tara:strand:+ start:4500 stop:5033 length:534 start_codon:yes stop_codon:yes gene_type:complete
MANHICPICESGQLHARSEWIDVEHMGKHSRIESHFLSCDGCGSEQAGTKEARDNKRAMTAFKKQAQGLLTGAEVLALRKHWQLSQQDAARIFGGGPVAFSKYESDDVMQSDAMDKLLRVADQVPAALEKLKADAGVKSREVSLWENIATINFSPFARKAKTEVIQSHEIEREACYG